MSTVYVAKLIYKLMSESGCHTGILICFISTLAPGKHGQLFVVFGLDCAIHIVYISLGPEFGEPLSTRDPFTVHPTGSPFRDYALYKFVDTTMVEPIRAL